MNKKQLLAIFIIIIPAYSFTMLPHQLKFMSRLPKALGFGCVLGGYLAQKNNNNDKNNKAFGLFATQDANESKVSADAQEKSPADNSGLTQEQKRNIMIGLAITATLAVLSVISDYFS
jgi:hypothetical protein